MVSSRVPMLLVISIDNKCCSLDAIAFSEESAAPVIQLVHTSFHLWVRAHADADRTHIDIEEISFSIGLNFMIHVS